MNRDLELRGEIKVLTARKSRLLRILRLRGEVSELEGALMRGTDSRRFLKIIIEEVCAYFKLDMEVIMGSSREQNICVPRQLVFYLGRKLKGIPVTRIGRAFQRDHSTVTHACQSIEERMETDGRFTETVSAVASACRARLEKDDEMLKEA